MLLGFTVDKQLNTRSKCDDVAKKANLILGCLIRDIGRKKREGILPLCKVLGRVILEYS